MIWIAWIIVFLLVFVFGYSVGRAHGLSNQYKREREIFEAFSQDRKAINGKVNELNKIAEEIIRNKRR